MADNLNCSLTHSSVPPCTQQPKRWHDCCWHRPGLAGFVSFRDSSALETELRSVFGMKQRSPNTLFSYWNELRAGRIAPRRLEVEPSRIAAILSETFMLERVNADDYPYRLAGTRLCELFGSELRSSNFLAGWQDGDQAQLARQLALVCERGAVLALNIEAQATPRHTLEFEAILLPLLHGGNGIGRIIGAMSLISPTPMLESDRPLLRRLRKYQLIWPDGRPQPVLERRAAAPALQAAPAAQKGMRPHLRVLEGGRSCWKKEPN
jgi:hypothetical protein